MPQPLLLNWIFTVDITLHFITQTVQSSSCPPSSYDRHQILFHRLSPVKPFAYFVALECFLYFIGHIVPVVKAFDWINVEI